MRRALSATLVLAASLSALSAQAPQTRPQAPTFQAATEAVVVDAVVRDGKGRPITDLTIQDFELLEDSVPQEIRAMTLVASGALAGPAIGGSAVTSTTAPAAARPVRPEDSAPPGNTVVALVFDRLSPEARDLAYRAALSYLDRPYKADDFIGVFLVDLSLQTLQTYTNDRAKLRAAIEAAAVQASTNFGREATRVRPTVQGDRDPATSPTAGAESPGPATESGRPPAGLGGAEAALAAMMTRMERMLEKMADDQQGWASTTALRALVTSLGVLPGRKTVVYFAEGIPLPEAAIRSFDILIELANQRNVAIYTVDAAGLRVQSGQAAAGRTIASAADDLAGTTSSPDSATGESMSEKFDRAFVAARSEPHASLARLAALTGGFLVENTNNLKPGLDRIEEDRRFHYLLTYSPANTDFRGEYRRIEVRVKRKDARVRARSGYSAVHEPGTFPTLGYEAVPLALLARTPAPRDLAATLEVLRLPQPDHAGRVALMVRVPPQTLAYRVDPGTDRYRSDFTILARITDASGEVVRKASQPYRLSGPAAAVEQARAGDVLFFRSPELPPGSYTVSYVVYDALADRAIVGSAPLDIVTTSPETLQVSDLVLIARAEQVPVAERDPSNPLFLDDTLLYPRLGAPLAVSPASQLPFYFTIQPGRPYPYVTARLSVARARQTVAQLPLTLDRPANGVIRQVTRVAVGGLEPGSYSLVLTVTDGASTVIRSAPFEIR